MGIMRKMLYFSYSEGVWNANAWEFCIEEDRLKEAADYLQEVVNQLREEIGRGGN